MKISKYTFLFHVDDTEFYIYNTLSNSLIEIDKDSYYFLKKAQAEQTNINPSEIDYEIYNVLVTKKIITENDIDSFLLYKSNLTTQRAGKSHMHLTIAPTMDCCFNCPYCFEKYKTPNYMSEETMDAIIKYLNSLESKPKLKLTWFGGEPLMASSQMEQFYKKLTTRYKKPVISNVITTGFHINENIINILQRINVEQVQITLDGLKDTHNNIKFTTGCTDSFNKVVDNIELLLKTSDIHVVFRVNLTKQNAHEYVHLYNYLTKRFKDYRKKGVSPAFVMDRGACNVSNKEKGTFFNPSEAAQFILELHHKYGIHSPFLKYPSSFFLECAIKNIMSISFDPEGNAYKCWELIGNKEYAIGKLNREGKLDNINETILNRHLYGADPLEDPTCSACEYLPVCNGGCPIQRLENMFDNKNNCYCTFYKGYMEEFLKVHLMLKKAGFENKDL